MKWWLGLSMVLLASVVSAEEEAHQPFVQVSMTLELEGVERALDDTRQSLDTIGSALADIAQSEHLTGQQQEKLDQTIGNLNELVLLSRQSMEALPSAFQHSKQTIATKSQQFFDVLRQQVLVAIALIGVVIIGIISAIFWFVLRPMQATLLGATSHLSSMAGAIKTTAQALDSISQQQEEIAKRLESTQSSPR